MELLQIKGKQKLGGEISLHGAKNSVLPILAATVLVRGKSVIHNCPMLSDVKYTIEILKYLGADAVIEGDTVTVDSTNICRHNIPKYLMEEMRSSIIFLGALASRCGNACLYLPGGCDIGLRPIDFHISGLKSLGYSILFDGNDICCVNKNASSNTVVLPFSSVGATENLILASVFLSGRTQIVNAAREPEIADLIAFLNKCGAKIKGASTPIIEIIGVDKLHGCEHTVISDRILASTLMSAAAVTSSEIRIKNVIPSHLMPVLPVFDQMGCDMYLDSNSLSIKGPKRLRRVKKIETMTYPGFPTDCQAVVMAALTEARGTSVIRETIFENRFKHVSQLMRFGADIIVNDRSAIINGVSSLHGADVVCTDLRGGAAVVICALDAEGVSLVKNISHIDRGYEKIENQLSLIGADIKRIQYETE